MVADQRTGGQRQTGRLLVMSVGVGFVSRPYHFVAPSLPLVGRFVTIFTGLNTLGRRLV